jgi:hypothetical protein
MWTGLLLARTRVASLVFAVVTPLRLPPAALAVVVIVLSAWPVAWSGASGIFVVAVGGVVFRELRAAGASRALATATTAMAGSLGVVLRPCLVVVLVATLNTDVTTDDLYHRGRFVFALTSVLTALAFFVWHRVWPPAPSTTAAASASSRWLASFAALRVVGQVGGTYLLLEGPQGMVVIDQHAAHERVVFERLRAQRSLSSTAQPAQPLLLPITIELSALERAALDDDDIRRELSAFGIDIEGYAHTTALVRALPPGLDGRKAHSIVKDALAELGSSGTASTLNDRTDAVCARLACHAAVRAGDVLAPAQVRALLEDLDRIDLGAHCPHGRPVVRGVDYGELAGWFDRG